MNKDTVFGIVKMLIEQKKIKDIATHYDVSTSLVSNVNNGRPKYVNKYEFVFPINKNTKHNLEVYDKCYNDETVSNKENVKCFVNFAAEKYNLTIKQLHIIVGDYSYNSINNWLSDDRYSAADYKQDKRLEYRLEQYMKMLTPICSLILGNGFIYNEQIAYAKWLGRHNADRLQVYGCLKYFYNKEIELSNNLARLNGDTELEMLKTPEDVERYRDMRKDILGMEYKQEHREVQVFMKAFHNKQHNRGNMSQYITYNDFDLGLLQEHIPGLDIKLVVEFTNFETRDNYIKRPADGKRFAAMGGE